MKVIRRGQTLAWTLFLRFAQPTESLRALVRGTLIKYAAVVFHPINNRVDYYLMNLDNKAKPTPLIR